MSEGIVIELDGDRIEISSPSEVNKAVEALAVKNNLKPKEKVALKNVIMRKLLAAETIRESACTPGESIRTRVHTSKGKLKELKNKDIQEIIFQRLWYNATEGAKKRQEEYDKIFQLYHPFQPDIGHKSRGFRDGSQKAFFDRLTYTTIGRSKSRDSKRCKAPDTNWKLLGKSSEELDQHARERANRLLDELKDKVKESKLDKTVRFKDQSSCYISAYEPNQSCMSVKSVQRPSSCHRTSITIEELLKTKEARNSRSKSKGNQEKKGELQGLLITNSYKRMLGIK